MTCFSGFGNSVPHHSWQSEGPHWPHLRLTLLLLAFPVSLGSGRVRKPGQCFCTRLGWRMPHLFLTHSFLPLASLSFWPSQPTAFSSTCFPPVSLIPQRRKACRPLGCHISHRSWCGHSFPFICLLAPVISPSHYQPCVSCLNSPIGVHSTTAALTQASVNQTNTRAPKPWSQMKA